MPLSNNQLQYAMYVIAEVESNWNWTSVYYTDPITIGIMQWYGTRAAALINRVESETPGSLSTLTQSLRESLKSYGVENNYWNRRYLTRDEGNSIIAFLSPQSAHDTQQRQCFEDFQEYESILSNWGMSADNPKPMIFAMSAYHQSPARCGRIIASCGGSATLERIYTTTLNDSVLGQYTNRYNTIYSRLNAWDGTSAPPDFGQNGNIDTTPGGDTGGISEALSKLRYIIKRGNNLYLYGRDEYANGVMFYPLPGDKWWCAFNADGTTIGGGNTGGGSASGSAGQQAVVNLITSWVGRFKYSQGAGRLDPLTSGSTDCSGLCWFAYQQACGIDVGTWTGEQDTKGALIASGSGANLPLSSMQLGDLVIFLSGSRTTHVEMYIGNNQLCGIGGGTGPTIKQDAQAYAAGNYNWNNWHVRRYL
jgi:hypothetical protein